MRNYLKTDQYWQFYVFMLYCRQKIRKMDMEHRIVIKFWMVLNWKFSKDGARCGITKTRKLVCSGWRLNILLITMNMTKETIRPARTEELWMSNICQRLCDKIWQSSRNIHFYISYDHWIYWKMFDRVITVDVTFFCFDLFVFIQWYR